MTAARARLRTTCILLAAAVMSSCSVADDASPQFGPTGLGSALASVLSQAEAQLSAESDEDQAITSLAEEEATETAGGQAAAAAAFAPVPEPTVGRPAPEETKSEPAAETAAASATAPAADKGSFLSSLFGSKPAVASAPKPLVTLSEKPSATPREPKPLLKLASTEKPGESRPVFSGEALPGVRQNSLFEITRKSGLDDDSDIDLHEDEPTVQLASAAGLARLAPNGLIKQTEGVDVACLKPSLVRMLKTVEQHFGRKMIVTSGYRSPERNRRVRGARNSLHMACAAADIQVPGVDKWELARYVRALPGRGGVGTYCHTNSIHIDVGPERDWNWRCRKRSS